MCASYRRRAVVPMSPARAEDGGCESAPVPRDGLAPVPPPLPRGFASPVLGRRPPWCAGHHQQPVPRAGCIGCCPRCERRDGAQPRMVGKRILEVEEEHGRRPGGGHGRIRFPTVLGSR